jgi:FkbM family methyltransferase
MGLESALRTRAHRMGLEKSPIAVAAYRQFSTWRFRNRWEDEVEFKGARFAIGQDLSLYPAVRNGGFEAAEFDIFLPTIRPDDTVWDVGANIGIYAVLLGRAAHRGHVVSFEPVPETRQRLVGNVARNGLTNVTIEPFALSDHEGEAHMAVHPDAHGCDYIDLGHDGGAARAAAGTAVMEAIDVSTTTGAAYAERSPHGAPDVIKVDIEGHEPEFLEGAWPIIAGRRPTLMMEVNTPAMRTPARAGQWDVTLRRLFGVYEHGTWLGPGGSQVDVDHIDVSALEPHAYTLLLRDPNRR